MLKRIVFIGISLLITLSFAQAPDTRRQYDSLPQMPGWPQHVSITLWAPSGVCLADINEDGYLEILLGHKPSSTHGTFHVWDYHGNVLPGWPRTDLREFWWSKPAVADIDTSYPGLEIIMSSHVGPIYAWHYDGTDVPGWPVYINSPRPPVIFDIDGDDNLEIIVCQSMPLSEIIYVFNHNGTIYPGWPQAMDASCEGPPSVGDVDGDGAIEICAVSNRSVFVWDKDGNLEPGWPKLNVSSHQDGAQPVLVDLDNDGDLEIINIYYNLVHDSNYVGIYHHDGTDFENWPQIYHYGMLRATPLPADIDNDGDFEIICGSHAVGSPNLLARHHTGFPVFGWPVSVRALECSPIAFDINDDGYREILVGEDQGPDPLLYAFDGHGQILPGWPIITGKSSINSAAVGDVDGDGDIEIAYCVHDGTVNLWTVQGVQYRPYLTEWGTWYHDNWNTGWFHPLAPQNVNAMSSPAFIRLTWTPNTESDLAGYNIYRNNSSGGPYNKINDSIVSGTEYYDIPPDSNDYYYCITAEIQAHTESRLSDEVSGHLGIEEYKAADTKHNSPWATIFSGPLLLPECKNCKVFDITGRVVLRDKIKPGIYFIEVDGRITQKVVKVK